MTTLYNYHPVTGEYLSIGTARPDPVDPDQYLIPAHATTLQPPAGGVNESAIFGAGEWSVVPDYRGVKYWLPDGSGHQINELGVTPSDDALESPPPASLPELKSQATDQITRLATDTRTTIAGNADRFKLAGWNSKAQLALRVLSETPANGDIEILQLECDQRGLDETLQELAQKQNAKAGALATAIAYIDGAEAAAIKATADATSSEALTTAVEDLVAKITTFLNPDTAS